MQAEVPIPGLRLGGPDIDSWSVVAHGPIVLPLLSEGLVIRKIKKYNRANLPREILVKLIGLGMPSVYVARMASRVYTQEELACYEMPLSTSPFYLSPLRNHP
jgi:hypothetical protein